MRTLERNFKFSKVITLYNREAELSRQKRENEKRLAALKQEVAKKRKALGKTTLSALSPVKTLAEMQQIDVKILEIRKQFRTEIKNGILQIVERYNVSFLRLAQEKKDEFETMEEFERRIAKGADYGGNGKTIAAYLNREGFSNLQNTIFRLFLSYIYAV